MKKNTVLYMFLTIILVAACAVSFLAGRASAPKAKPVSTSSADVTTPPPSETEATIETEATVETEAAEDKPTEMTVIHGNVCWIYGDNCFDVQVIDNSGNYTDRKLHIPFSTLKKPLTFCEQEVPQYFLDYGNKVDVIFFEKLEDDDIGDWLRFDECVVVITDSTPTEPLQLDPPPTEELPLEPSPTEESPLEAVQLK